MGGSAFSPPDFRQQGGEDRAVVGLNAVMADGKNRYAGSVIDAHDASGLIHAGHILASAGNTHVQNEVGLHGHAALADLDIMGQPAVGAQGTGATQLSAQQICQLAELFQIRFAPDPARLLLLEEEEDETYVG